MKISLNIRRIFLFTILFISSSVSRCQIYKYIGLEDGLSNQKIYHIQKDRKGYMWFLTQEGVDRYDGKQIKHYNFSDGSFSLQTSYLKQGILYYYYNQVYLFSIHPTRIMYIQQ